MARKTYASSLEQNLEEQLAALKSARDEAGRQKPATGAVSEQVSATVPSVVMAARRPARRFVLLAVAVLVVLVAIGVVVVLLTAPRSGAPSQVIPTQTVVSGTPTGVAPAPTPTVVPSPTTFSTPPSGQAVLLLLAALLVLVVLVVVMLFISAGRRRRLMAGAAVALATGPADVLEERISRLEQIRAWLKQDSSLMDMVDDVIGQNVRAAARTQMIFSAILGVVSLVVGWLLSGVASPLLH